jgi:hypothetical protein
MESEQRNALSSLAQLGASQIRNRRECRAGPVPVAYGVSGLMSLGPWTDRGTKPARIVKDGDRRPASIKKSSYFFLAAFFFRFFLSSDFFRGFSGWCFHEADIVTLPFARFPPLNRPYEPDALIRLSERVSVQWTKSVRW